MILPGETLYRLPHLQQEQATEQRDTVRRLLEQEQAHQVCVLGCVHVSIHNMHMPG
jgi:hypothetical protein